VSRYTSPFRQLSKDWVLLIKEKGPCNYLLTAYEIGQKTFLPTGKQKQNNELCTDINVITALFTINDTINININVNIMIITTITVVLPLFIALFEQQPII